MPRFISLSIVKILVTLIPPLVEDEQPPIIIKIISISLLNVGHRLKSSLEYPVVVIIEATWKNAARSAVKISWIPLANKLAATVIVASKMIIM